MNSLIEKGLADLKARQDAGEHIAQFRVTLSEEDTPDTIADKVHELEMEYFPKVIEECIKKG